MDENATSSAERFFTPVHRHTGERLKLRIADKDLPRGRRWKRVVVDLDTGQKYRAWSKSCGLPNCLCDAYVEECDDPEPSDPAWCACGRGFDDAFYAPDNFCDSASYDRSYFRSNRSVACRRHVSSSSDSSGKYISMPKE